MTRSFSIAPALLTLGLLSLPGAAQQAQQVDADIKFAQGLASRWQFIDLAEEVLNGIAVEHKLTASQKENLGLVRCEVYATSARRERNPENRTSLYESAIQGYQDFISDNEYSDLKSDAELALVQLTNTFVGVLELQLADLAGDQAIAMRAKIGVILEGPLARTGELMGAMRGIESPSAKEKSELAALMLDRGIMLAAMGRVSEDGTYYFGQAEAVLEDLAMEYGEHSGWGLKAYLEMARIKGDQGYWGDSVVFYQFVVDAVMPPDNDTWAQWSTELSQGDKDLYWRYMEMSLPGLLEAAAANGETQIASTYALLYWNRLKSEGFTLSVPRGYLALLASAKALLDTGGYVGGRMSSGKLSWYETEDTMTSAHSSRNSRRSSVDMALTMAKMVNEDNRGNTLQTRAQKLISEITVRPGVVLGPDMLFEAAQGQYKAKEYSAAILGCKRVLAALDGLDPATRSEFGPKVLNMLGNSYLQIDRSAEAIMVFKDAVTTWKGDPEFDSKNAKGMYNATNRLKARSGQDTLIQQLFIEAENFVTTFSDQSDTGDILFRQAMRLYGEKNFDGAFAKFQEVPQGSGSYEKGLVYTGACRYQAQKRESKPNFSEAAEIFDTYLTEYVPTHSDDFPEGSPGFAKRQEARALAIFYTGSIAYKQKRWADTSGTLTEFFTEFPSQNAMAPSALYMALIADVNRGDIAAARSIQQVMLDNFKEHSRTGKAAGEIYKQVAKLHKAALDGSPNKAQLLQALAELMQTSNRLNSKPSFSNLRRESGHWIDLQNWAAAESVLRRTSKNYQDVAANRKSLHMNVQPDLAKALLMQSKLPEALEVLRPLIPAVKTPDGEEKPEFRPYSTTVGHFQMAAVGWLEGATPGGVSEVLGAGDLDDVKLAADWMSSLARSKEKYTSPWYQLKFNYTFTLRRQSQSESAKLASAQKQLATMRTDIGEDFIGITEDFTKEGLDGTALRQHFVWLNRELN